jgi:hypothetical protein
LSIPDNHIRHGTVTGAHSRAVRATVIGRMGGGLQLKGKLLLQMGELDENVPADQIPQFVVRNLLEKRPPPDYRIEVDRR